MILSSFSVYCLRKINLNFKNLEEIPQNILQQEGKQFKDPEHKKQIILFERE